MDLKSQTTNRKPQTSQLPLHGKRIVVTRAEEQAPALLERLRELGAEPLACPAIAIAPLSDFGPLDDAIGRLHEYDWLIVTSANGVEALFTRLQQLDRDPAVLQRLKIGAIGPATAAALVGKGIQPNFMPSDYVAESLVEQIGEVAGQRVFLPRADIAREALAVGLRARGALVDEIAAYRTIPGTGAEQLNRLLNDGAIDAITFTSSSTVRYLLDGLASAGNQRAEVVKQLNGATIICIGPITAGTARQEGLRVDAVAQQYTIDGLIEALVTWVATTSKED